MNKIKIVLEKHTEPSMLKHKLYIAHTEIMLGDLGTVFNYNSRTPPRRLKRICWEK